MTVAVRIPKWASKKLRGFATSARWIKTSCLHSIYIVVHEHASFIFMMTKTNTSFAVSTRGRLVSQRWLRTSELSYIHAFRNNGFAWILKFRYLQVIIGSTSLLTLEGVFFWSFTTGRPYMFSRWFFLLNYLTTIALLNDENHAPYCLTLWWIKICFRILGNLCVMIQKNRTD